MIYFTFPYLVSGYLHSSQLPESIRPIQISLIMQPALQDEPLDVAAAAFQDHASERIQRDVFI
jgi:hypothetical protein